MKRKKNSLGDILSSIVRAFWEIFKGLLRLLLKILVGLGLWLPGLYALLGVFLYYGMGFDPFDFSVYSIIYLSGGFACVICAVIISVRNIFINPVKNVVSKKRNKTAEEWEEEETEQTDAAKAEERRAEEDRFSPPRYEDLPVLGENEPTNEIKNRRNEDDEEEVSASSLLFDWMPRKNGEKEEEAPVVRSVPKKEIPQVYFSKINPSLLVHEYKDRFELYKVVGDTTEFVGVEYK